MGLFFGGGPGDVANLAGRGWRGLGEQRVRRIREGAASLDLLRGAGGVGVEGLQQRRGAVVRDGEDLEETLGLLVHAVGFHVARLLQRIDAGAADRAEAVAPTGSKRDDD